MRKGRCGHYIWQGEPRLVSEVWGRTHEDVKMSALPLGRRGPWCQN